MPKRRYKGIKHRQLIEKQIGRTLNEDEVVHHKNGDSLDDSIDNLQIMTKKETNLKSTKNTNYS